MQETLLFACHNEFSEAIIKELQRFEGLCHSGNTIELAQPTSQGGCLLLAQLHCLPQPPCTEILSDLFTGAFETLI